jgi:amino acid adenylation domain-containing protein
VWEDDLRPLHLREGRLGDATLFTYVQAQASRRPDALAVADEGRELSYLELLTHSRAVSAGLQAAGVGRQQVIGVLAPRGGGWIAAMLGIWHAGGVYLPLDPAAPAHRREAMLRKSGCRVALVDESLAGVAAAGLDSVTCLSLSGMLSLPPSNSPPAARADDLAYVLFTSGSTGEPKGAMVEHRGMLNHLLAKVEDLELSGQDRVAQVAPVSFDISIWQALAPLVAGAPCYVASEDEAHDPRLLQRFLRRGGITVAQVVPSLLRAAIESGDVMRDCGRDPLDLRVLSLTGEAAPPALCREWLQRYPQVRLLNAYGPTECSDDVTHHFVSRAEDVEDTGVSIGRAVRNAELFVLQASGDRWRSIQPGESGELFVGGPCVGRGYIHDPARTAEAFASLRLQNGRELRLYRTGDLVRLRADGSLDFCGRLDRQVKVRGARVELGDIEVALERTGMVRQAAVLLKRPLGVGASSPPQLVAYVVLHSGATSAAVGSAMKVQAGPHMRPDRYIAMDDLPLTRSGKVDLNALAARED